MSDLDLVRKRLLKDLNKPFCCKKPFLLFPMCYYEAMNEEQRSIFWKNHASITIYYIEKNQELYKLIKGGKLREVKTK